jgi:ArsR family transcriptional regulator, virulence genes transcriptional regulator
MNLEELQSKAGAAEAMLKAVANRNRLVILCELLKGERSVSALQGAIGLSQSALSQHLARLRADELVATRRESQTIYYSLSSKRVARLIGLLYELYCAPGCDAATAPAKMRRKATS